MKNIKDSNKNKLITDKITEPLNYDKELELDTLAEIVFNEENYSKIMLLDIDDFYSLDMKELFASISKQYDLDKTICLPVIYPGLNNKDCYLSLYNRNNYVITSQVLQFIKKLKEISNARKLQDISYQTTVKIAEGTDALQVRNWLITETAILADNIEEITTKDLNIKLKKSLVDPNPLTISTGFKKFDNITGGLMNGTMTIMAAAQSLGKTTWAINLLVHLCGKLKKSVLFVSLEMNFENLHEKMISCLTGIPTYMLTYKNHDLSEEENEKITWAMAEAEKYNMYRIGQKPINANDIRYKLKEKKIDVVIVDYLQKVKSVDKYSGEYEAVSNVSRELKDLSNEFNIPFIVIASLNREYSKRGENEPRVSDIRGSGSIEYDADMVLLLNRDSAFRKYNDQKDKDEFTFKHSAQLIIAKNRFGESNTVIDLFFDGSKSIIREWNDYEPK